MIIDVYSMGSKKDILTSLNNYPEFQEASKTINVAKKSKDCKSYSVTSAQK